MVFHAPQVQRKVLQDEELAIVEEASKEEVEGLSRCVEVRNANVNEALVEENLSWVRSFRVLNKRAKKSKNQDTLSMLIARVSYSALI